MGVGRRIPSGETVFVDCVRVFIAYVQHDSTNIFAAPCSFDFRENIGEVATSHRDHLGLFEKRGYQPINIDITCTLVSIHEGSFMYSMPFVISFVSGPKGVVADGF